jgi:phosphoribosylanthranilate isomerase
MKIKICGITNLNDALAAIDAGADLLGFNFYSPSPRFITPQVCAEIQSSIINHQSSIQTVGVFVNSSAEEITSVINLCGLSLAQLSGDEPMETLAVLGGRAFKALRLREPKIAAAALTSLPARAAPPACLVDAYRPGEYGGTGQIADWSMASDLARRSPILLAGGLTPENVAAAVQQVHPWGVDVASGVEAGPGKKDVLKVRRFIQNVRQSSRVETVPILPASIEDLLEILALQKLAYRSEADQNKVFTIPPMTQAAGEIAEEFGQRLFLKAILEGCIVGSVRAHLDGMRTCHIGRLIVKPEFQNRGIGTQLMKAIETQFAGAQRYELFTSERSARNIYLYQKLGYRIFRREQLNDRLNLVYLEKRGKHS